MAKTRTGKLGIILSASLIIANKKLLLRWAYFQKGTSETSPSVLKVSISTTLINVYLHSQHRTEEVVRKCFVKKGVFKDFANFL